MDCQVLVFFAASCNRGEECGGQEQAGQTREYRLAALLPDDARELPGRECVHGHDEQVEGGRVVAED